MNPFLKNVLIAAGASWMTVAAHADPDAPTQAIFKNLLSATVANDYDKFLADCDAPMHAALTKPILQGVSQQIEPRARKGYEAHYLGELQQRGFQVHLWRLTFSDGGDDILATLSVKDGKAGGFYLR